MFTNSIIILKCIDVVSDMYSACILCNMVQCMYAYVYNINNSMWSRKNAATRLVADSSKCSNLLGKIK